MRLLYMILSFSSLITGFVRPYEQVIPRLMDSSKPLGKEEIVHGVNTYLVGNTVNPKAIIVICSDIFGLALLDTKLIADAYAAANKDWLVYLPDFFQGDPAPIQFADIAIPAEPSQQGKLSRYTSLLGVMPMMMTWMEQHKDEITWPYCKTFLERIRRETYGRSKIGIAGFAWGGRYAIRAGQNSNSVELNGQLVTLVDVAVAMHPSNLVIPDDVNNPCPTVPLSIGWGEGDEVVDFAQKAQFEEAFAKIARKPQVEHRVYSPGRHGFALRGNPNNPTESAILEATEQQALDWFSYWLR